MCAAAASVLGGGSCAALCHTYDQEGMLDMRCMGLGGPVVDGPCAHMRHPTPRAVSPHQLQRMPGSGLQLCIEPSQPLTHTSTILALRSRRYIVTARGLAAMLEKFKNCDFGRCPRVLCEGQPCLPVGTHDIPGQSTVKVRPWRLPYGCLLGGSGALVSRPVHLLTFA